jgi:hypothetical protein
VNRGVFCRPSGPEIFITSDPGAAGAQAQPRPQAYKRPPHPAPGYTTPKSHNENNVNCCTPPGVFYI